MVIFISAILGAIYGAMVAKKRGGVGRDLAQYAATHALIFTIFGVFITVIVTRMAI